MRKRINILVMAALTAVGTEAAPLNVCHSTHSVPISYDSKSQTNGGAEQQYIKREVIQLRCFVVKNILDITL